MGLNELQTVDLRQPNLSEDNRVNTKISLSEDEWSEELAIIGKRRNLLEKALKQLIRFTLKAENIIWSELGECGFRKFAI